MRSELEGWLADPARLEALGRVDQARKAYEAYLLESGAVHAQEAKKRLERLRP